MIEHVIQPVTWAGIPSPNDARIMVCAACSTPAVCAIASRCARARQEDYDHAKPIAALSDRWKP